MRFILCAVSPRTKNSFRHYLFSCCWLWIFVAGALAGRLFAGGNKPVLRGVSRRITNKDILRTRPSLSIYKICTLQKKTDLWQTQSINIAVFFALNKENIINKCNPAIAIADYPFEPWRRLRALLENCNLIPHLWTLAIFCLNAC